MKSHKSEPRFGQPRGAPARAERRGFIMAKSMGGTLCRPRSGSQKAEKFCLGVSIQPRFEPILARISEIDERSAPPPAAAKRRPASQKNFLCNFNLRAPLKNYSKKERKVFLLDSALTRGRRDSLGQLTGKKFPPLESLHFLHARRNSCYSSKNHFSGNGPLDFL